MAGQAFEAPRAQHFFLFPHAPPKGTKKTELYLTIIGLDTDDGPEHSLYHPDIKLPVEREWVQNLKRRGILQTCLVKKDGPRTLLIDGRQRSRGARVANEQIAEELGFDLMEAYEAIANEPDSDLAKLAAPKLLRVPCVTKKPIDQKDAMAMAAAANVRPERHALGKAIQAQRMLDAGMGLNEVAIDMGVTTAAVREWQALLGLGDRMKQAVMDGLLRPSAAVEFADLSEDDQNRLLDEAKEKGLVINVPEARRQRVERNKAKTNGTNGHGELRGRPIGIAVLRKLHDHEEFMAEAPPEIRQFLNWVLGAPSVPRIKGMTRALKEIGVLETEE